MILLIDHYDSFTYNLYQQIASLGKEVKVIRYDDITIDEIRDMQPEAIVLSPGPGRPDDIPQTVNVVKELYTEFPILGVCLGHQIIGAAFGGEIVQANRIMHGKTSLLNYERKGLFKECFNDVEVMRYHSLVIEPTTLSKDFEVIATSKDDGEIMAIQHKQLPIYGVQFHPESIGTPSGNHIVKAFLANA
jgi:anthranilate synthase component 2